MGRDATSKVVLGVPLDLPEIIPDEYVALEDGDGIHIGPCPQGPSYANGNLQLVFSGEQVVALGVSLFHGWWGCEEPVDLEKMHENSLALKEPLKKVLREKFGIHDDPEVMIIADYG